MAQASIELVRLKDGGVIAAYLTITSCPTAQAAALASLQRNCAEHVRWLGSESTVTAQDHDRIEVSFEAPVTDEEMLSAVIGAAVCKAEIAARAAAENPSLAGFRALAAGFGKPPS